MSRCEECVTVGNQLVLMKKGRARSEGDECPICCLPLPLETEEFMSKLCCTKRVCNGCVLAAAKRSLANCPFCRTPTPDASQALAMTQERVAAGDPAAIYSLGHGYQYGNRKHGVEKDVPRAVKLLERAAELGEYRAHYNLAILYREGTDVKKDMAKAIIHFEAAAMGGYVAARNVLGYVENHDGNSDLALQHWMISAKLGDQDSLNMVKDLLLSGDATKADYAAALRGYQDATRKCQALTESKPKQWELRGSYTKPGSIIQPCIEKAWTLQGL